MKNLTILLAVLSMGTLPLMAEEGALTDTNLEQIVQVPQKQGSLAISEIRKSYENGDYDSFLKELDDSYQTALSKNQLTQLMEMREGVSPQWKKWDEQARQLQEKKGRELLAAVEDERDSPFRQKVISSVTKTTTAEQDEAIFRISTLRQMAPNTGANSDENRLIDLDLEYEYKSLHTNMPGKNDADLKEKQIVLRMEKAQKMVALSMSFEDTELKKDVFLYVQDLDERLAQIWDTIDLNRLAYRVGSSEAEEKVISILSQTQEEFSELAQQFMDE